MSILPNFWRELQRNTKRSSFSGRVERRRSLECMEIMEHMQTDRQTSKHLNIIAQSNNNKNNNSEVIGMQISYYREGSILNEKRHTEPQQKKDSTRNDLPNPRKCTAATAKIFQHKLRPRRNGQSCRHKR